MINGKPYLVSGAELGCNVGRSDFPTIFDISDEKNPRKVGEFRLEVMDHCASDPAFKATQKVNYGLHYNNVVDNAWGKIPAGNVQLPVGRRADHRLARPDQAA